MISISILKYHLKQNIIMSDKEDVGEELKKRKEKAVTRLILLGALALLLTVIIIGYLLRTTHPVP